MTEEVISIPDIGGEGSVTEVFVKIGDTVSIDDPLILLESDKSSMEIPSPVAGDVVAILVKVGDKLQTNDAILRIKTANSSATSDQTSSEKAQITQPPQPSNENTKKTTGQQKKIKKSVHIPDIGVEKALVTDVFVSQNSTVEKDQSLIALESEKAAMDIPSPYQGNVISLHIKKGETICQGDLILEIEIADEQTTASTESSPLQPPLVENNEIINKAPSKIEKATSSSAQSSNAIKTTSDTYAGPAVRKLARQLGVDLKNIQGSAKKGRIIVDDVHDFVKKQMSQPSTNHSEQGIPTLPSIDFAQWGRIEEKPLNRLQTLAAQNFKRSWLNIPHVTQFDEADITELEHFRKTHKEQSNARGVRLTPLPFLLKACSYVLEMMPQFCASLNATGDKMILKQYIHIGIAVDTEHGLFVPVIRDVNKKGIYELSIECVELAKKAQQKKLHPNEMKGGCFTISSLGSIGGTNFTPIINSPELAILGISKATYKPVWNGQDFEPRLMLPLSLSYNHCAINGADAARFTTHLLELLSDIRRLLL